MTLERGYQKWTGKALVPASEARVSALEAAVVVPDGVPPAANPTVTLRPGIGALFVVWEPVANASPVTYDVYAVPAADVARLTFPPLDTDKVGEVLEGTAAQIRALPDGTDLSPEGSYAIAVYARDADGTCPTDAVPVIGAPAKVNSEDLALNALTVDHLTGNDALFQALQAEDIEGVNITGSSITGSVFNTAPTGTRWRIGGDGDYARLTAVPTFASELTELSGVVNLSHATESVQQVTGTAIQGGAFDSSASPAAVQVGTGRAWTGSTWGTERASVNVTADDIRLSAGLLPTDTTAKIEAHTVTIQSLQGAADKVIVKAGNLSLDSTASVAITGPTATLNGSQIATVPSDSGWVAIPLVSGFTAISGETPSYRKIGNVVYLRGRVQGSHTTGNTVVGNLPSGFRPAISNEVRASTLNSAVPARFFVNDSGQLNINVATAGTGSVSIGGSYLVD